MPLRSAFGRLRAKDLSALPARRIAGSGFFAVFAFTSSLRALLT